MSKESINHNENFDESSETNENKREKLGQIFNEVKELALKKFDETEDLNSALEEAIRVLNERFSIAENKEISQYEQALLLSFNQTVHGRVKEELRREFQNKFEEEFKPLIIKMSNWEEAMVTAVHKNVNP